MSLEEAGGRVGLVGWLVGRGAVVVVLGFSAVQVHREKMAKRVYPCHRTQCFQRNSRSDRGRGERKEGRRGEEAKKKKQKRPVCWPHVTVCAFSACSWLDVTLNEEAEG